MPDIQDDLKKLAIYREAMGTFNASLKELNDSGGKIVLPALMNQCADIALDMWAALEHKEWDADNEMKVFLQRQGQGSKASA